MALEYPTRLALAYIQPIRNWSKQPGNKQRLLDYITKRVPGFKRQSLERWMRDSMTFPDLGNSLLLTEARRALEFPELGKSLLTEPQAAKKAPAKKAPAKKAAAKKAPAKTKQK